MTGTAPAVTYRLSPRMRRWVHAAVRGDQKVNLLHGPIRTSKTVGMSGAFTAWAQIGWENARFLLASKTMQQVREALLPEIRTWCGDVDAPITERHGLKQVKIGTNTFVLADAFNLDSTDKIRGLTFAGAWLNEATLLPDEFLDVVLDRCHLEHSKVWLDTNPDSPLHPIYVRWVHGHESDDLEWTGGKTLALVFRGKFADNPSLPADYEAQLRDRHSGLYLARMVDGEWVIAQGLVYSAFDAELHVREPPDSDPDMLLLGVDPGQATTTHATLFGLWGETYWALDEYRWDVVEHGAQREYHEHIAGIETMLAGRLPRLIYADPEDSVMRHELGRRWGKKRVRDAHKPAGSVRAGVNVVNWMIGEGHVYFAPRCRHSISEIGRYFWDARAAARGEELPTKLYDHAMDVLRYVIFTRRVMGA